MKKEAGGSTSDSENDANSANAWKGTDGGPRVDAVEGRPSPAKDAAKAPPSPPTKAPPTSSADPAASSADRAARTGDRGGDRDRRDEESGGDADYAPRWARSSRPAALGGRDDGDDDDDPDRRLDPPSSSSSEDPSSSPPSSSTDELPPFADDASRALHAEIKLLERRRDEASSATRSHVERVGIIDDHLRGVRQEIDHTNSLVAAKRDEADAEEHLLSLSRRELGRCAKDASAAEGDAAVARGDVRSARSQIEAAEDDLEKLRTDLNWNQEELEQWATAATKKEEESLALQKYALADELKIKELTLTIEDLTKMSVEKRTLLENEVTETRSNQTELDKLAERFRSRHGERRELLRQWKETIESMNDRDRAINALAEQYAGFAQREDESKKILRSNREQYELLESERDDSQQDLDHKERLLQTKRQDLASIRDAEHALKDEVDSLRRENSMVAAAAEGKRAERKRARRGLEEKRERAGTLNEQLDDVRDRLANEKLDATSKERVAETIEKTLANREKELQQAEKDVAGLKSRMYKDSQRLADLRKREADLIADVRGAQANIKNFASKANELENKRARQRELLYNANFQLQRMEKKVARGLGERSNEEQDKLQSQIDALGGELESERQKKVLLVQQQRKLRAELRAWTKKCEASEAKYGETVQRIDDIGLEIFACEQSLKEMVAKKEEAMVSHDVTLLDVRRLRDSLRGLLEEVCSLKQEHVDASSSMREKKERLHDVNDVKMAQLRVTKEERHKSAIDLGKLRVALEKTKAKYDMVRAINAGKGEGEGFESPELKLILAAQKREELQREGDALDETIQKKEKEIKAMKKTLAQLRERNTNFRSSFSRADMNGVNAQQLKDLEERAQSTEDALSKVQKELQVLQKRTTEDRSRLERATAALAGDEERIVRLAAAKSQFESDAEDLKGKLDEYGEKVADHRNLSHRAMRELQHRKFHAELVEIQADRIGQLLVNLGEEFPELREDILNDMKRMGL